MPTRARHDTNVIGYALDMARADVDDGPSLSARVGVLQDVRALSTEASRNLDEALIGDCIQMREGLSLANDNLIKAKKIIDQYAAMPLHPATFLQYDNTLQGRLALVISSGGVRAVALSEDAAKIPLRCGDEVYLGSEQSVVVGAVSAPRRCGEIAEFDRLTPDCRLVLKARGDEQIIADPACTLTLDILGMLRPGDSIRWDRTTRLAYERLDNQSPHTKFALRELPDHPLRMVAGDDKILNKVLNALKLCLLDPEKSKQYGLEEGSNTILLYGPPGCGKTLITQVSLSEIARLTNKKAYFVVVQASAFESPWVGETQRHIRECFASLREAAAQGQPSVLFLDEIDSIGRARGGMASHHSDNFLATLISELDGFNRLKNVAVIAASNRKDLLDPALLSRLVPIPVGRPGLRAGRAILSTHLPEALPYHPNGVSASSTRTDLINTAVSKIYAANAGNELCTLKFADGRTRVIAAHELVSGRMLKQICMAAKQSAFHRDISSGAKGIQLSDIETAVNEVLEQLSTSLSPQNVHSHLDDLPADVNIVSVVPHVRRVPNRQRYLRGDQG